MRLYLLLVAIMSFALAPRIVSAQATAPTGYHYVDFGTPVPNDPCWYPALVSPGAVQNVNRTIGKPLGVPQQVLSINDLAQVVNNALWTVGIRLDGYDPEQGGLTCHVTLGFANGSRQTGVLSFRNPGEYAAIEVQWVSDGTIARDLAAYDQLDSRKDLNVAPDLKSPLIQACVARAWVLGVDEQFPGQLWAACAQKNGSDRLPPASREKHWP